MCRRVWDKLRTTDEPQKAAKKLKYVPTIVWDSHDNRSFSALELTHPEEHAQRLRSTSGPSQAAAARLATPSCWLLS